MIFLPSLLVNSEIKFSTTLRLSSNFLKLQSPILRNSTSFKTRICPTKCNSLSSTFASLRPSQILVRSSPLLPYTPSFGLAPVRFNSIFSRIGKFLSPKSTTTEIVPSPERISLAKRMKLAYKTYGKTLIVVHIVTTAMWLSSAYLLLA